MTLQLLGFHHLTAVTADVPGNRRFYTESLGMRLVKKTVNQDDVSAYHLFYADGAATPGTDITFFDWPVGRERRGTNSIVRTGLRVSSEAALEFWRERFAILDVQSGDITRRDGRAVIDFEDPEGQRLALVADDTDSEFTAWTGSAVPSEYQIRGLGPVTISVPSLSETENILTTVMNMRRSREYSYTGSDGSGTVSVHVFEMGRGGTSCELHVMLEPDLAAARGGAGGAHHVAFRVPDAADYARWSERLRTLRVPTSGPVDRYYFRSIYFREPNGILFELATDGPGFAVDEPLDRLGERLSLPPFLEGKRSEIETRLKPL